MFCSNEVLPRRPNELPCPAELLTAASLQYRAPLTPPNLLAAPWHAIKAARRARHRTPRTRRRSLLLCPPPAELSPPLLLRQRVFHPPTLLPFPHQAEPCRPSARTRCRPAIAAAARAHRGAPTSGAPRSQLNPGTGPPRHGVALRPGLAHPHRHRAPPSRTEPPPPATRRPPRYSLLRPSPTQINPLASFSSPP